MDLGLFKNVSKKYLSLQVSFSFDLVEIDNMPPILKVFIQDISDGDAADGDTTDGDTTDGDAADGEEFLIFDVKSLSSEVNNRGLINIESDDGLLGHLIIGKNKSFDLPSASSLILLSHLLHEISVRDFSSLEGLNDFFDSFEQGEDYISGGDFLFIKPEMLNIYIHDYMDGVELWGKFSHDFSIPHKEPEVDTIKAFKGIKLPTDNHKKKLKESILASNSFDRFLKKYQLLELLYDYIVIAKLRTINGSLFDFRDTMTLYSKDEIVSLKMMLSDYIDDTSKICTIFYTAEPYETIIFEIFQKYSKESNPLKSSDSWDKFWQAIVNNKLTVADMNDKNNRI
ncbi:hypothetical protein, partial [Photobacterium aquimaris]